MQRKKRSAAAKRAKKLLRTAAMALVLAAAVYMGARAIRADASDLLPIQPPSVSDPADALPQHPSGGAGTTASAPSTTAPATNAAPTTNTAGSTTAKTPAKKAPAASATPAPTPTPGTVQSTPGWAKAPLLEAAVTEAMKGFPGGYSVAVQDLKTGQRWILGGEEHYLTASTVKIPVALYALERYRAGKLDWNATITYTEADYESPAGIFEGKPFGGQYPISVLVGQAISHSNNVAVNMLGRYLGWQNIRDWTKTIGAELYRRPDASPDATVLSELGWWLHLEQLSRQDPKNAELVLQPLRDVDYTGRIATGLPAGVPFVHKYGSYDGNEHDTGWIMGEHPFILIVMTDGAPDQADQAIAGVTKAIYGVMSK
jgi:beta-lactamase class A